MTMAIGYNLANTTGKMIETTPDTGSSLADTRRSATLGTDTTPATGLALALGRNRNTQQKAPAFVQNRFGNNNGAPPWIQAIRQNVSSYREANPNLNLSDPAQYQAYHQYMLANLPQGAPSGLMNALNQNYINRMQTLQQQQSGGESGLNAQQQYQRVLSST